MGRRATDLTNMDFGMLHVVRRAPNHITPNGSKKVVWECICNNCGKTGVMMYSEHLLKQGMVSCGCMKSKRMSETMTTHGKAHTRLYNIWCAIKRRCYNPSDVRYDSYGGRGITVCDEWKDSYENFQEWALSNGYDENAPRGQCTIERKNVDEGYSPENCVWATMKEQMNNMRINHIVTIDGVSRTISQWADVVGINKSLIYGRISKGWSEYDAVMVPKGGRRNEM